MLLYGTKQNIITTEDCIILNFSSLTEQFQSLHLLPSRDFTRDYNKEFDLIYAQYILSNDELFVDFMRIIYPLYEGKDVFVLIDDSLWIEQINDSLFKLIQQRYGYNAYRINCMEDFMYAENSCFSELGLINLDQDKDRLAYIVTSIKISQGEKI